MLLGSYVAGLFGLVLVTATMPAQQPKDTFPAPLDPARHVLPLQHTPLREEYIWTADDATVLRADHGKFPWNKPYLRVERHIFRREFTLESVPEKATLYLAGPRAATVFLNGVQLGTFASDPDAPINFHVFHADASKALRTGRNVLAIRAVRGRGVVTVASSKALEQLAYGEVLAIKLVGAPFGAEEPVLLRSDKNWRSAVLTDADEHYATPPWAEPSFADSGWKPVDSLGPVESDRDMLQWSADAGMYGWPGYRGMTAPLGNYSLLPGAVTHVFEGTARLEHLGALQADAAAPLFTVHSIDGLSRTDGESPAILLDFGREIAGRLLVESASDTPATLSITYGESELEALATGLTPGNRGGNYLGTNLLEVPARGAARGPKSAFRFVRIRFLRGAAESVFKSIRVEGIAYPVRYVGSFESSDLLLNRIWETGAHTVHLCMQDDLWDAPKRDRGRWAGDLDVEGRVIETAFGDTALLQRTLAQLGPTQDRHVNGIPGYSALWLTTLATMYGHDGDAAFVRSQREAIFHALAAMRASLDPGSLYVTTRGAWPFVDWVPGLYGNTPGAKLGTSLQYVRGFRAAALLLRVAGDEAGSRASEKQASLVVAALRELPREAFNVPQLQALALETGVGSPALADTLARIRQSDPADPPISPYFSVSVLDALAESGHGDAALAWLRTYWGGMLADGATSFWENYDLRWPKGELFHLSLQADGSSGYFTSLAHGWSAGPTAWLSEQVLGVRDPADGYRSVTIAPRLFGLAYARGAVPTPHGAIHVDLTKDGERRRLELEIPPGVEHARVYIDPPRTGTAVLVDQKQITPGAATADGVSLPELTTGKHLVVFTPEAK